MKVKVSWVACLWKSNRLCWECIIAAERLPPAGQNPQFLELPLKEALFTKGLWAKNWTSTSFDALINDETDLLRGRNEGCDHHMDKITHRVSLALLASWMCRYILTKHANIELLIDYSAGKLWSTTKATRQGAFDSWTAEAYRLRGCEPVTCSHSAVPCSFRWKAGRVATSSFKWAGLNHFCACRQLRMQSLYITLDTQTNKKYTL